MHGGFGRESTFNNMAAIGPDFKKGPDPAPVSNADIAPTLAKIMGIPLKSEGPLAGRVLEEALLGGPSPSSVLREQTALPAPGKLQTVLVYQEYAGKRYFDKACLAGGSQKPAPCSE
jgi:hypothetical protein